MKNRNRTILLLLCFLLCLAVPGQGQAKVKAPRKPCHAYVVMDAGSGKVLFGQDHNKKIYPASTAKLMTAIVCLEKGDYKSKIKTQYDVVYGTTPGTYSIGIGAGVTY
ncbi:MAG: D-alanyl-D-alanine carboxypeptidase, partial [Eubacterium sp.]|nr:D-alanyl-D-alanine carboxypeptidase [Eubacterium sp.]